MFIIMCDGKLKYNDPADELRRKKHLLMGLGAQYYKMSCPDCGYQCSSADPEGHMDGMYTHNVPFPYRFILKKFQPLFRRPKGEI